MPRLLVTFAALLAVFYALPSDARGPYGSINVGNWKGGAYANDTGAFTSCIAGSPYNSGIYFMVIVDADFGWSLGFTHSAWRLNQGQSFPIALTFDGQTPFNVNGIPVDNNLVRVPMPANSVLINQFRRAKIMTAFTQGQLFQFSLAQTAQLLPVLANCVKVMKERGIGAAGDFSLRPSIASQKPRQQPEARAAPIPGSLNTNPPPQAAELQIEALELASNFIMKAGLQNPRVLSRSETPPEFASFGASWKSDEATGAVRIIPTQGDTKGLDVTAAVIGADAKECKGKFISGRNSELVDSEVVFRGVATCEDTDGTRIAQYFIIPRKKGGFVMFSVVSGMKTEQAKVITKEEKAVDFRKAALVVSGH